MFAILATLLLVHTALSEIEGHSGIVFHVNKYGHYSGHSTHYDYRFYPEKSLLDHLIAHHKHSSYHHLIPETHIGEELVGYGFGDEHHDYPGSHEPFYYYIHDDEHHFHK
ncbi:hypothetical protein JTE90_025424 [Oedothorax gibbosus]|uniref:Uncharacterized protein n=1 Tax=Oedothorax gibbosus TaxID=931172 RepID=A0AAV6U872_9ARAC|nr:hypothetical protein JTE90_025424 [Oedothorax gibbosus]